MKIKAFKGVEPEEYNKNGFQCFKFAENATLKFMKFPNDLQRPDIKDICDLVKDHNYVKVRTPAGLKDQPRKTLCFGQSYTYSGQEHPVEDKTPKFVYSIIRKTEELFGEPVNMCLLNVYFHGNHSISAHSDDEEQMGDSDKVFCWVIGKEARLAKFRSKDKTKVYSILIPEGLYVMSGKNFQKDFTHEFPKLYQSMFKNLKVPEKFSNAQKADWVWDHKDEIKETLRGTKDYDNFLKWCEPRASYTLRYFPDEKNKKIKK
jgi:alkylated DNA repair dioxygenase AlkB